MADNTTESARLNGTSGEDGSVEIKDPRTNALIKSQLKPQNGVISFGIENDIFIILFNRGLFEDTNKLSVKTIYCEDDDNNRIYCDYDKDGVLLHIRFDAKTLTNITTRPKIGLVGNQLHLYFQDREEKDAKRYNMAPFIHYTRYKGYVARVIISNLDSITRPASSNSKE